MTVYWTTLAQLRATQITTLWLDKLVSVTSGFDSVDEFVAQRDAVAKVARGYGFDKTVLPDGWGRPIRAKIASDSVFALVSSDGSNGVYEHGLGDDRTMIVPGESCDTSLQNRILDFNAYQWKVDHRRCNNATELLVLLTVAP
ncbi:MAG: hypothetical protein MUF23_04630 [Pirellula sp.]|nr:hypothetical protein [Pirellula sp.]